MSASRWLWWAWLGGFACRPEAGRLTDPEAWVPTEADGFDDLDEPACEIWWLEDGVVEVQTDLCFRWSVVQAAPRSLAEGEVLSGGVQWGALDADAPAEAHVALRVDGEVVLERRLPIPGPAGTLTWSLALSRDVARGSDVIWHLHNHGANSYRIGDVWSETRP